LLNSRRQLHPTFAINRSLAEPGDRGRQMDREEVGLKRAEFLAKGLY